MKNLLLSFFIICSTWLYAQVPYVLTEADVTFANGEITDYHNTETDIIIPPFLNGQKVTTIGECAFCYNSLNSVSIPNSVTAIGNSAFRNNSLSSITIPSSITSIGHNAFYDNSLSSIDIPDSITTIGNFTFGRNSLASVTMLNSVTSIGDYAFSENELSSIDIPDSVTSIGKNAFAFNSLATVTMLNSVTSIGDYAFSNNSLSSIDIPDSVTSIGAYALAFNNLTSVVIPNSVIAIGRSAFQFNSLTSFSLPTPGVDGDWDNGTKGESISDLTIAYTYLADDYTPTDSDFLFENGTILDYYGPGGAITIPDTINGEIVTAIGYSSFEAKSLTSIGDIPNSVTYIGENAFSNNSLSSVVIPDSVTAIGRNAFSDNSLTSFSLPTPGIDGDWDNGTKGASISDLTIAYTYLVTNYNPTASDFLFENGTILDYYGPSGAIIIPDTINGETVTAIGDDAFYNNDLTSVTIPNSVIAIGVEAFSENSLTSVIIPDPVTYIGEGAFAYNSLTSVTISNAINYIGGSVFYDNNLTSVTIPNVVKYIGESAFAENELISITIPDAVTTIGYEAFAYNKLTSVSIGNSVKYIGEYAFSGNQLNDVAIPESVIAIGSYAFAGNFLGSFILPEPVISGNWDNGTAGESAANLTIAYTYLVTNYNATDSDFLFENGTILDYYGPGGEIKIPDFINGETVTTIGSDAFSDNGLTGVTIPNSVTSIENDAFSNNDLTSVTIPDSVKYIGDYAFSYSGLASVILSNALTYIGEGAFESNSLTNVTIPDSVITIGYGAFSYNNIETVSIPDSVTYIGEGAFSNNISLPSFELPSPIVPMGYTFNGWVASNDVQYANGATTTDFASSYKVNKTSFSGKLVSVLLEGATGNLEVTGDQTLSYLNFGSANIIAEVGQNLTLTPTVSGYNVLPEVLNLSDIQDDVVQVFAIEAITYNITYHVDGGSATNPSTYTVETPTISLEAAIKDGYTFVGWFTEDTFENEVTKIALGSLGDIELFAKFKVALSVNQETITAIKIYPNPSSDYIRVSGLTDTQQYSIYNSMGAEVKIGSISNNKRIDIQNFANGLYFLKFENGHSIKFIKE